MATDVGTRSGELPGQLVSSPLSGAEVAELYAAQRLPLVRLAVLLVDDLGSAEDVVPDVFAKFVRGGARLRDLADGPAYLRIAVVNGCRSALRRRRTARAYTSPHPIEPDGPAAYVVLNEEHREVLDALGDLAPRQREVLVLRYWSDLTEAQIAEALGISRGSVKSTASRALDALEKLLEARA